MSMQPASGSRTTIDWIVFSLYLSLVFIGWLMVFAAEYKGAETSIFDLSNPIGKQLLFIGVAFAVLLLILNIDWKFWRNFAYPIYGLTLLALVAVLIFGGEVKGARSWFFLGSFSLQPAEFAKFSTCLILSVFLANPNTKLSHTRSVLLSFGFFAAPAILILLQPDAGSAIVFGSFMMLLYREGLSPIPLVIGFIVVAVFVLSLLFNTWTVVIILMLLGMIFLVQSLEYRLYWNISIALLAIASVALSGEGLRIILLIVNAVMLLAIMFFHWYKKGKFNTALSILMILIPGALLSLGTEYAFNRLLEPHQQERINVWLHPDKCDPHGPLYNVMLSKMAIGSGGLTGKGYLKGSLTKLNYVPEQSTDFIFCTVGEEQGFIGSITILGLFLFLIIRILKIAERQRLKFFRNYAYGVAGLLLIHFVINVGMTLGLLPIIGIPLPLLSYGGSSLLAFTMMLGVLLRFDSQRSVN